MKAHESVGADYLLAHGCAPRLARLVEQHVAAKRYLCWKKPAYLAKLSEASRGTLEWQGGPMSDAEGRAFEAQPDLNHILAIRGWDEVAKDPHANPPGLDAYRPMLRRHIDHNVADRWARDHHVVFRGALRGDALGEITAWTDELEALPESPGQWMKYFERVDGRRQLCRAENFIPFHDGLRAFLSSEWVMSTLEVLMGEPARLFKEKINYKLPGGAGFTAHQDAPAFTTFDQRYHITMLVAVDEQRADNGGLEMSDPVETYRMLDQAPDGTIDPEIEAALPWRALDLDPGDIVFFDSYIPHRSGPNRSDRTRRGLYVTYNRESEGDRRSDYYAHKRQSFPPECERVPGVDYSAGAAVYNLGNPIR